MTQAFENKLRDLRAELDHINHHKAELELRISAMMEAFELLAQPEPECRMLIDADIQRAVDALTEQYYGALAETNSEAAEGGDHEVVSTIPECDSPFEQGAAGEATTTASPAVAERGTGEFAELLWAVEQSGDGGITYTALEKRGLTEGCLPGRAVLAGHLDCKNTEHGLCYWLKRAEYKAA